MGPLINASERGAEELLTKIWVALRVKPLLHTIHPPRAALYSLPCFVLVPPVDYIYIRLPPYSSEQLYPPVEFFQASRITAGPSPIIAQFR